MNVLIMADYRAPNSGNFVASLLELAERMRKNDHKVYFMFPNNGIGGYSWSQWLEEHGFSVTLIDADKTEEVTAMLKDFVSHYRIDLVHSHFGMCHSVLVKNRRQLGNVKILIHDHMDLSPEGSEWKQKLRIAGFSAVYRICGIGVVSVMEQKSKAYLFCKKSRKWYIPNGLSLRRNVPKELSRVECRDKMGLKTGDKLCLFLGWDMYRKGIDIAVRAVSYLQEQGENVHLGIVGMGEQPAATSLDWIEKRSGINPQQEWIHFYPSTEDMFAYHRAADVYLSASRKEAFSYGILEAISQNTPLVVSNIAGTSWSKVYSRSVCYPVEDVESCAGAIRRALRLVSADSNGVEIVEKYGIEHWSRQIIDIYHAMLSS